MESQTLPRPRGRPPLNRPTPQEFSINAPAPVHSTRVPAEISRMTLQDWNEWGGWLLNRCNFYWPGLYTAPTMKGQISTWSSSNDFLFIKNVDAVLLAMTQIDPVSRRSIVIERFGWSRHAKPIGERRMGVEIRGEGQQNLMDLYRFCRDWARTKKVAFILSGWSCDIALSQLSGELNGDWVDWVITK